MTGAPRWRLLRTWGASPELAMGLDELLLEHGGPSPVLRLYTWSPPTLSLGYFQRLAEVPGARTAAAVVRRITGGGAIEHAGELTFSIAAPLTAALYRGPVADSYVRVHALIAAACAELGVRAALRGDGAVTSDLDGTGMCFHASTALDLCWGGAKGVGSAQRRRGGRVLHHGSIKLAASPLETGVATFAGQGVRTDPERFGELLCDVIERDLAVVLEPDEFTEEERTAALALGARYSAAEFVARR